MLSQLPWCHEYVWTYPHASRMPFAPNLRDDMPCVQDGLCASPEGHSTESAGGWVWGSLPWKPSTDVIYCSCPR